MCLRERPRAVLAGHRPAVHLRRDDVLLAHAEELAQQAAGDDLALAAVVDVGGVEEGDPALDGAAHDRLGRRLVERPLRGSRARRSSSSRGRCATRAGRSRRGSRTPLRGRYTLSWRLVRSDERVAVPVSRLGEARPGDANTNAARLFRGAYSARDESLLNLLLPNIAVGDEPDAHERKRDSDHLEGPGRALRQVRHQPSCTEADGEARQPGSPPRQVGPLGRQPRASCGIAGLIEPLSSALTIHRSIASASSGMGISAVSLCALAGRALDVEPAAERLDAVRETDESEPPGSRLRCRRRARPP